MNTLPQCASARENERHAVFNSILGAFGTTSLKTKLNNIFRKPRNLTEGTGPRFQKENLTPEISFIFTRRYCDIIITIVAQSGFFLSTIVVLILNKLTSPPVNVKNDKTRLHCACVHGQMDESAACRPIFDKDLFSNFGDCRNAIASDRENRQRIKIGVRLFGRRSSVSPVNWYRPSGKSEKSARTFVTG